MLLFLAGVALGKLHRYISSDDIVPFNFSAVLERAGFADSGWTLPGHYPLLKEGSFWLESVPTGYYPGPGKNTPKCLDGRTTRTCFLLTAATFWWGKPIKLTSRVVTGPYHFSLVSRNISIHHHTTSGGGTVPRHLHPPAPWRIHASLETQVRINGTLAGHKAGFFWFKPLFWAVGFSGRTTRRHARPPASEPFSSTFIYPVSRAGRIQGAVGFEPSNQPVVHCIEPLSFTLSPVEETMAAAD